jgi:hypothetical protein
VRVVLIAGWNEQSTRMRTFIDGRNGIDGLAAYGFDCTIFPADGDDLMRDRIDRFASFLDTLRDREPDAFPVATLGYSVGGLVNRGFLRAYPERAGEIAATVQIAAPNAGLITNYTLGTMRLARVPTHILADIDVEAPFMTWLNGVSGAWVPDPEQEALEARRRPVGERAGAPSAAHRRAHAEVPSSERRGRDDRVGHLGRRHAMRVDRQRFGQPFEPGRGVQHLRDPAAQVQTRRLGLAALRRTDGPLSARGG